MSASAFGRVGDRVRAAISRKEFQQGTIKGVYYKEEVNYVSGPIGSRIPHTGSLDVVSRWVDGDNRDVRITGVCPSVFLKVYAHDLSESVFVEMDYSDIVKFGEVSNNGIGNFVATLDEVSVKVTDDTILFKKYGQFTRADKKRNLLSFSSGSGSSYHTGIVTKDYSKECWDEVHNNLQEAWAKENNLYAGSWRITDANSGADLFYITTTPNQSDTDIEVSFSFLRDDVAHEISVADLCNKIVFVTMADLGEEGLLAEKGPWKLYRESGIKMWSRYFLKQIK